MEFHEFAARRFDVAVVLVKKTPYLFVVVRLLVIPPRTTLASFTTNPVVMHLHEEGVQLAQRLALFASQLNKLRVWQPTRRTNERRIAGRRVGEKRVGERRLSLRRI